MLNFWGCTYILFYIYIHTYWFSWQIDTSNFQYEKMLKSVVLEFVNQFWATLPMWIRTFTAMHRYDYSDVILNPRCFWCPFCGFVMWCRVRCNATWKSCSFCVLLLFFGLSTLRCAWIVGYLTCAGWNAELFSRFQPHFMLMLDKLPPKDIKRLKMWEHSVWMYPSFDLLSYVLRCAKSNYCIFVAALPCTENLQIYSGHKNTRHFQPSQAPNGPILTAL